MRRIALSLMLVLLPLASVFADEPKARVAHIELRGVPPEEPQPAAFFGPARKSFKEFLDRLDKARDDDSVRAVVLELRSFSIPLTHAQELRAAVARLQQSGKPVLAVLGPVVNAGTYTAAAGCDAIAMPPGGWLMLTGIRMEMWFYKGLLDRLGIDAYYIQAGAYKGAAEPFTRTSMSPAYREQMNRVVDDLYRQLCLAVAGRVGGSLDEAAQIIDNGPYVANRAKEVGLVDYLAYPDEVDRVVQQLVGQEPVEIARHYGLRKRQRPSGLAGMMQMMQTLLGGGPRQKLPPNKPRIALIYATGAIVDGKSSQSLLLGKLMGDETLVDAIRKAAEDELVRAIVLRVDSPGGSATASEHIYRALKRVDKPVVVSMGRVAASGGYYISLGGDVIYAEPATLTGSIGVVGGRLSVRPLLNKIGIRTEAIQRGRNAAMLSVVDPVSESQQQALRELVDRTYELFLSRVAEARGLSREELKELAEGRIWTGQQAAQNGLVDRVGTLADALAEARRRGGIGDDEDFVIRVLPEPRSVFEQIFELSGVQMADSPVASLLSQAPEQLREGLQQALLMWHELRSGQPKVWYLAPWYLTLRY